MRYNDGKSSSGHGWTAKLVDLSRVLSLGATAQPLMFVCVSLARLSHSGPPGRASVDYYCRVGWVGWREVAVSVDSLVYRSSAGGSWRRGRARRNAALQRPCARGSPAKGDPRSRRGEEEEEAAEEEDDCYGQSSPQRVTVWSFLGTGYVVLCSPNQWLIPTIFSAGAVVPDFLSFFLSFFVSSSLSISAPSSFCLHVLHPLLFLASHPVKCSLFEKPAPPGGMRLLVRAGLHSMHPHLQVHLHLAGPEVSCSQSRSGHGQGWQQSTKLGWGARSPARDDVIRVAVYPHQPSP